MKTTPVDIFLKIGIFINGVVISVLIAYYLL
jgi:hypothetical protein